MMNDVERYHLLVKIFPTLIVSSEVNFHTIWEPAINELQLTYIGNQRWLYRKDLDRILEEFNKLLDFSRDKAELDNIYRQCVLSYLFTLFQK